MSEPTATAAPSSAEPKPKKMVRLAVVELMPRMLADQTSFLAQPGADLVLRTHLGLSGPATFKDLLKSTEPDVKARAKTFKRMSAKRQGEVAEEYAAGLFWQSINLLGQAYGFLGASFKGIVNDTGVRRDFARSFFYVTFTKIGDLCDMLNCTRPPCTVAVEFDVLFKPPNDDVKGDFVAALKTFRLALDSCCSGFLAQVAQKGPEEAAALINMFYLQYMEGFKATCEEHDMGIDVVARNERHEVEFAEAHEQLNKVYRQKIQQDKAAAAGDQNDASKTAKPDPPAVKPKPPAEDAHLVDISGLNKFELIHCLWQNTKAQGVLARLPTHWDIAQAMRELSVSSTDLDDTQETDAGALAERLDKAAHVRADYVCGRPIKLNIFKNNNKVDPHLYNRDAGEGTFQMVVAAMRDAEDLRRETAAAAKTAEEPPAEEPPAQAPPSYDQVAADPRGATVRETVAYMNTSEGKTNVKRIITDEVNEVGQRAPMSDEALARFNELVVTSAAKEAAAQAPPLPDDDDDALRFVSPAKAREIAQREATRNKAMEHYWEKAAAYVAGKNEAVIALDDFESEFEQWEEHYLKDLPTPARITLNLTMPKGQRALSWMWMTQ